MNKLQRDIPERLASNRCFSATEHHILLEKTQDSMKMSHSIATKGLVQLFSKNMRAMYGQSGTKALDALYRSKFVSC